MAQVEEPSIADWIVVGDGTTESYDIDAAGIELDGLGHPEAATKIVRFKDTASPGFKWSEMIIAFRSNGLIQVQARVAGAERVYTHPHNNRRVWFGPYLHWRAYDASGIVIMDWNSGQINRLCYDINYYHRKDRSDLNIYDRVRSASLTISAYKYIRC